MKYFHSVTTEQEAKKLYRKLAMDNHPDRGGDNDIMAEIINEYKEFLKNVYVAQDSSDAFKAMIDALVKFDGIDIEIIGTWIWVSGETYPIHKELGKKGGLGFEFSRKKTAWYWHEGEYKAKHRKDFTLDEVRNMHEVKKVKSSGKSHRGALAGV